MYYHRKENAYYQEEDSKALLFLYQNFLGRCILKVLTRKFVSNLGGYYMNSKFSKHRISKFVKKNHIDMGDYEEKEYCSFNDFFTRKIKEGKRPLVKDTTSILSPADQKLTIYPIHKDTSFWVKNSCYTIEELLQDKELASKYNGGYCFVYRLGVTDYHRYSYIDQGKVLSTKKIDGIFHTVQPIAFKKYPVFSENTREYQVLKTTHFNTIIQMEVGALMVGKICNYDKKEFKRGEEKGYFCFGGSTVIVLVEKNTVIPDEDILKNSLEEVETKVSLFEAVGRMVK